MATSKFFILVFATTILLFTVLYIKTDPDEPFRSVGPKNPGQTRIGVEENKHSSNPHSSTIVGVTVTEGVVVLTQKNFTQFFPKNRLVMVAFYAPWCIWSKRLLPEYAVAATGLKGQAVLSKVDATKEIELAKKFNVTGYPTLYFFVNGIQLIQYDGLRTSDAIVTWVKGKMSALAHKKATEGSDPTLNFAAADEFLETDASHQ